MFNSVIASQLIIHINKRGFEIFKMTTNKNHRYCPDSLFKMLGACAHWCGNNPGYTLILQNTQKFFFKFNLLVGEAKQHIIALMAGVLFYTHYNSRKKWIIDLGNQKTDLLTGFSNQASRNIIRLIVQSTNSLFNL